MCFRSADNHVVHFIWAVRNAQGPGHAHQHTEFRVGHALAPMDLNRGVHHLLEHIRGNDLDGRDVDQGTEGAVGIERPGRFVGEEARLIDTGQGRGVVCFDSDRDGDLDLVITNNQPVESVVFYRNDLAGNNRYLTVKLSGAGVNTDAIGAMIEITDGTRTQIREIRASNHFVSQNPAEAHFGLGSATSVDMTIFWPNGGQTVLNGVAANQYLTVSQ